MGMDLTLYVLDKPFAYYGGRIYPSNKLSFDRDYSIFSQIRGFDTGGTIPVTPLPKDIKLMLSGDEGTREENTDPYGSELTYATAKDLKKLKAPEDASDWNKTIIEMLQAMKPEVNIILWWC